MTMRLIVQNTDASRVCRIVVRFRDVTDPTKPVMVPQLHVEEILPGGSADVFLHDGKDALLVEGDFYSVKAVSDTEPAPPQLDEVLEEVPAIEITEEQPEEG